MTGFPRIISKPIVMYKAKSKTALKVQNTAIKQYQARAINKQRRVK